VSTLIQNPIRAHLFRKNCIFWKFGIWYSIWLQNYVHPHFSVIVWPLCQVLVWQDSSIFGRLLPFYSLAYAKYTYVMKSGRALASLNGELNVDLFGAELSRGAAVVGIT
jgi:hypothetical protein